LTSEEPLAGSLDPEALARGIPRSYVVKGMFFSRLAGELGLAFEALLPRLEAPPRLGRYVPFNDYPQSDYLRLSAACAAKAFPGMPLREALRRLGRADYGVFATSTFGRVILSVVGDARSALLKTPFIYAKMAPGDWTITGEGLDDRTVRLEFAPAHGTWEYQLGQLEGVVLNYGHSPITTIEELPERRLRFDIRHD
jgi:uncharacterized protein (TIGR02265 family)